MIILKLEMLQQLMGQLAITNESNLSKMMHIGRSCLLQNKVDSLDEIYTKIERVTAEEILEISNEILVPEKLSTLVYKAK